MTASVETRQTRISLRTASLFIYMHCYKWSLSTSFFLNIKLAKRKQFRIVSFFKTWLTRWLLKAKQFDVKIIIKSHKILNVLIV